MSDFLNRTWAGLRWALPWIGLVVLALASWKFKWWILPLGAFIYFFFIKAWSVERPRPALSRYYRGIAFCIAGGAYVVSGAFFGGGLSWIILGGAILLLGGLPMIHGAQHYFAPDHHYTVIYDKDGNPEAVFDTPGKVARSPYGRVVSLPKRAIGGDTIASAHTKDGKHLKLLLRCFYEMASWHQDAVISLADRVAEKSMDERVDEALELAVSSLGDVYTHHDYEQSKSGISAQIKAAANKLLKDSGSNIEITSVGYAERMI